MIKTLSNQTSEETKSDELFFNNLIWMTTEEAARYLRKSANALRILVHRKIIRARKFRRRLYLTSREFSYQITNS